jgi:hypothetical protein
MVGAFDTTPLARVTFAQGSQLQVIGDRAFAYTELRNIDLPEGLCQIGAAVMASKGYDYRQILSHYYPGTTLSI